MLPSSEFLVTWIITESDCRFYLTLTPNCFDEQITHQVCTIPWMTEEGILKNRLRTTRVQLQRNIPNACAIPHPIAKWIKTSRGMTLSTHVDVESNGLGSARHRTNSPNMLSVDRICTNGGEVTWAHLDKPYVQASAYRLHILRMNKLTYVMYRGFSSHNYPSVNRYFTSLSPPTMDLNC